MSATFCSPLSFSSSVSSHLPLHVSSFSVLAERLQEPISHSCDLHPVLGPVCGVKVGRAKATCILQAGAQLTPPWLPTLLLVTVYTCINTRGEGQGQKSELWGGLVTLAGRRQARLCLSSLLVCVRLPSCCYNKRHKWYSNLMQTAANPGIWQQGLQLKSYF